MYVIEILRTRIGGIMRYTEVDELERKRATTLGGKLNTKIRSLEIILLIWRLGNVQVEQ